MNFNIKRTELIEIFSDFTNILKDNSIKPAVSGLKIESKDGFAIFTGTNLEVNYIKTVECETFENGVALFKPHLALEYIKLLDDDYITLSSNNEILSIHLAEFSLLAYNNFPEGLAPEPTENITLIKGTDLYYGFEKTKFSASPSSENLAINCIRTIFEKKSVSFVSTDSYRLTYFKNEIPSAIEREVSIPLESIAILCKLIKDVDEEISVGYYGDDLIFIWDNSYFLTKTTTVPFPNFRGILSNSSFSKEMEFNHSDLKSALKKVLTVARTSSETKNGALLDFKGNKLTISASSGRAKINQKIDVIKTGDDFKCSLNIKFLLEFIDNLNNNVFIKGNSSSAMFEISEIDNESYKYILMPLALRD